MTACRDVSSEHLFVGHTHTAKQRNQSRLASRAPNRANKVTLSFCASTMSTFLSLIGGSWVLPAGAACRVCVNPNNNELRTAANSSSLAPILSQCISEECAPIEVRDCSQAQVDEALSASTSMSWTTHLDSLVAQGVLPSSEAQHHLTDYFSALQLRYDLLLKVVAAMESDSDAFALIDAVETGVPLFIAKQITYGYGPAARAFLGSAMSYLSKRSVERIPGRYGHPIVRECVANSPAVIIAPWNVPFGTILPKVFVALLSGCAVIIKPSEFACGGITLMIRKLLSTGLLPPTSLQLMQGGPITGRMLTNDASVRCIQFTGSSPTAFAIAEVCAKFLRPFHAECGGSNAAVIDIDADIDLAVRCVAMGLTTLNGQWCMGLSRIFVHTEVLNEFLHKMTAYMTEHACVVRSDSADEIPKSDEAILIGPLSFTAHAERLKATCEQCHPETSLLLGEFPDRLQQFSAFFQPRLLLKPNVEEISRQELFGPVAGVIPFAEINQVVPQVNLATGQLACYIFGDAAKLYRLAPKLRTGMVMINSVNFCFEVEDGQSEPHVDFVGTAGHGSDGNGEALASFFTSSMWVGVNGPQPIPKQK